MGNLRMNADQISYKGGNKPMTVEQAIKNAGNTGLAHTADIAQDFSTEVAYSAGDMVYYNGSLYVFTADHAAGAWSSEDTQAVTISSELATLKSGLIDNSMVPVNTVTLGTIATNENIKSFMATKNGYVTVDSGNVGATNPTVTCSLYQIARNYGAATTVTIASYTGVKFCTIPVKAGDMITVNISGHTVDAEVLQISYS